MSTGLVKPPTAAEVAEALKIIDYSFLPKETRELVRRLAHQVEVLTNLPKLFQVGNFTLASGRLSSWKIECDAITKEEWEALALMLLPHVRPFGSVYGVPRGGYKLSEPLAKYTTPTRPPLVVDDVWTTGGSMIKLIESSEILRDRTDVKRAVVFARNPVPNGVVALFQMPGENK